MKNARKAVSFICISLLCGISVAVFYEPFSFILFPTRLWFLEFPLFSVSMLIRMACILFAGMFFGRIARKHAIQTESKLQRGIASSAIFLNAILLTLPVLNLISLFIPRTITGVVDYKLQFEGRGYICVTETERNDSWSQEVDFDDSTMVYEQDPKIDQHKKTTNANAIQSGQIVEIGYIDNDTSVYGIRSLNITILKGQLRPYKNTNCGHRLP